MPLLHLVVWYRLAGFVWTLLVAKKPIRSFKAKDELARVLYECSASIHASRAPGVTADHSLWRDMDEDVTLVQSLEDQESQLLEQQSSVGDGDNDPSADVSVSMDTSTIDGESLVMESQTTARARMGDSLLSHADTTISTESSMDTDSENLRDDTQTDFSSHDLDFIFGTDLEKLISKNAPKPPRRPRGRPPRGYTSKRLPQLDCETIKARFWFTMDHRYTSSDSFESVVSVASALIMCSEERLKECIRMLEFYLLIPASERHMLFKVRNDAHRFHAFVQHNIVTELTGFWLRVIRSQWELVGVLVITLPGVYVILQLHVL